MSRLAIEAQQVVNIVADWPVTIQSIGQDGTVTVDLPFAPDPTVYNRPTAVHAVVRPQPAPGRPVGRPGARPVPERLGRRGPAGRAPDDRHDPVDPGRGRPDRLGHGPRDQRIPELTATRPGRPRGRPGGDTAVEEIALLKLVPEGVSVVAVLVVVILFLKAGSKLLRDHQDHMTVLQASHRDTVLGLTASFTDHSKEERDSFRSELKETRETFGQELKEVTVGLTSAQDRSARS